MKNTRVRRIRGLGELLISYSTPVALLTEDGKVIINKYRYSATTTRHVNKWLSDLGLTRKSESVSALVQEDFINLLYQGSSRLTTLEGVFVLTTRRKP